MHFYLLISKPFLQTNAPRGLQSGFWAKFWLCNIILNLKQGVVNNQKQIQRKTHLPPVLNLFIQQQISDLWGCKITEGVLPAHRQSIPQTLTEELLRGRRNTDTLSHAHKYFRWQKPHGLISRDYSSTVTLTLEFLTNIKTQFITQKHWNSTRTC